MGKPDGEQQSIRPAAGWNERDGMTTNANIQTIDGVPTYASGGDTAGTFANYYPEWLGNLADDVTIEGSLLDGAIRGPDAVKAIIGAIRTLYERQDFNYVGPWGDDRFIEDYSAAVAGEPIGCVVMITRNAAGQTKHIAANYRPRSSVLLLSRLVGEKLAGTPYADYFLTSES
jgi:hypothetical protein